MTTPQPTSPKFSEAYAGHLLSLQSRNLSQRYLTLKKLTCQYWKERFGDAPLANITADEIRRWLVWLAGKDDTPNAPPAPGEGKGMAGISVDVHYRNLKSFWLWCEKEDLITKSPIRRVERPKFTQTVPDILTEGEAQDLLKQVRNSGNRTAYRDYCILLFFMDTGVRLEELVGLSVDDVNIRDGYSKVLGKGKKERLVPMGLELRQALSKYQLKYRWAVEGEDAFFVNERGYRFGLEGVRGLVVRALRAHVPRRLTKYGPHCLRHFFVTYDLVNNGDIEATREIAGHSDSKTTRRYNHLAAIVRANRISPMDAASRRRNGRGRDTSRAGE